MKTEQIFYIIILQVLILFGCKNREFENIKIGEILYETQNYQSNQKLGNLITRTLSHDESALLELVKFQCGGGAGCYELGFVISQLIYRIGESNFINLTHNLNLEEKSILESLIKAGLEYGDNNYDGKSDKKLISKEFPNLKSILEK